MAETFDDGAVEALGYRLQMLEMLLHQGEGIEVSEAVIELRRAFEVGEK